jgi:hypothetical protein
MAKVTLKRVLAEEYDTPDYRDSEEFNRFCLKIVEMVSRAERKHICATYRYFSERIGKRQRNWLYEAVDACKRKGLIRENSKSVLITSFVSGGSELKPSTEVFSRTIAMGAKKSILPDWGV